MLKIFTTTVKRIRSLTITLFIFLFSLFSSVSLAYDIFPGKLAKVVDKEALHEQMSLDSKACAYLDLNDESLSCKWPSLEKYITNSRPKLSDADWALTRGVEWPDNPVRSATKLGALGFAAQMASNCARRKFATGGLVCKSHYYDLQFMHAMSNEFRQPADKTQKQILEWLQFVYVAILDPKILDKTLGELMQNPDYKNIASAIAPTNDRKVNMASWVGWSLFSYLDAKNIAVNRHPDLRDFHFDFLIGVMLHTIQDSFSAAHTKRGDSEEVGAKVTCEPVMEFFTYQGQDDSKHSVSDKRPVLDESCKNGKSVVDDPILAGARVIRMAQKKTPWIDVKEYLQNRVFPITKSFARSSSGPFGKR